MFGIIIFGIAPVAAALLILALSAVSRSRQARAAAAIQAASEADRQRQQAQRVSEAEAKARRTQAAAALRKQVQAEKRQASEAKRAAAHAAKLARAAELAELAERRLQAEKALAELRRQASARPAERRETISGQALTLDEFAASLAPHDPPRSFPVACQLAKKYADNAQALAGKSFTVTEKLDGVRCLARVDRAEVQLYARSGKRIEGLAEIEKALAALNVSAVFDGELLIADRGALPSKEQYKRTCSIVASAGQKSGIAFHVFDMVPLDIYTARAVSAPYSARRAALQRLEIISPVEIVPVLYAGTDASQIEKHFQLQRAASHEGVMINVDEAPYAYARTASLLKYKVMQDCDLQIVAVNPGTGKNADSLGSLTVAYKGGTVRVGAGIPDALRRAVWADPAAYIGRVVTVQYFEETQDRTGKKSLRFPAFKELRELGKEVSYA